MQFFSHIPHRHFHRQIIIVKTKKPKKVKMKYDLLNKPATKLDTDTD